MAKDNQVRIPKQKRSIEKKEKILTAAYKVFSEKGYYKTNTPEIASVAGVSVGCLYSYFTDKHTIFLEVFERYEKQFDELHEKFIYKMDEGILPEQWFREYMVMLIEAHDNSIPFQREIKMLYYSDPDVAALSDAQHQRIQDSALGYIKRYKGQVHFDDIEAAAAVSCFIIGSVVDEISLRKNPIDRNRLLNEGVKALCRYLLD
jgi:AcrR family transcriptional regulator